MTAMTTEEGVPKQTTLIGPRLGSEEETGWEGLRPSPLSHLHGPSVCTGPSDDLLTSRLPSLGVLGTRDERGKRGGVEGDRRVSSRYLFPSTGLRRIFPSLTEPL